MSDPLSSPELRPVSIETDVRVILHEWLEEHFNGATHTLDSDTCTFPQCDVSFDQGPVTQTLDGTEIRVLVNPGRQRSYPRYDTIAAGRMIEADARIQFWLRSNVATGGTGNSNYVVNRASQILLALLLNPVDRVALARKGIHHLRPGRPQTITSSDYAMRRIDCRALLVWHTNV